MADPRSEYAQRLAERWKTGLAQSDQSPERISYRRQATDYRIYTPGSEMGIPVSVLGSLERPRKPLPQEVLAEKIDATATALLGLAGGAGWYAVEQERHAAELARVNASLRETAAREREQRALAEGREAQLRQDAYADQFELARRAWEKGSVAQAVELLDGLRPRPGAKDLRGFEWYYLKGLCHPLHAVWRGHQRTPDVVAVSPTRGGAWLP